MSDELTEGVIWLMLVQNKGIKLRSIIITHSKTFYEEPTIKMHKNPDREGTYKKPSYFSVPRWENEKYLKPPEGGYWELDKKDRIAIKRQIKNMPKSKNKRIQ